MTLNRRMLLTNSCLFLAFLVFGGAALWGVLSLRRDVRIVNQEYNELQIIEEIRILVEVAHGIMRSPSYDRVVVGEALNDAANRLEVFHGIHDAHLAAEPEHEEEERDATHRSLEAIRKVLAALEENDKGTAVGENNAAHAAMLGQALDNLLALERIDSAVVHETRERASRTMETIIVLLLVFGTGVLAVGVMVVVAQHKQVIVPLQRLREGVRHMAGARFTERLEPAGDDELRAVAREFNQMAEELDGLYRDLGAKVASKSKELVRTERLASVGFLAAGVAHEINNPLSIIATYAEMSLRKLRKSLDAESAEDAERTLDTIHREAFRCKQIIEKLMALTRGQRDTRQAVAVTTAIEEVVSALTALGDYRQHDVTLDISDCASCRVSANEVEFKQVLMNLVINSLEATPTDGGQIRIRGRLTGDEFELAVIDNGRGMSRETIENVFEPFYSNHGHGADRGTGLGLSITHAIVTDHGGQIRAESDGPGRGARFIVTWPLLSQETGHESASD